VNDRGQAMFWMTKPGEKPLDSVETKIDRLGMQAL
jgi:hypothetical protein